MTPADPTPDIATPEDIEAQCGHMLVDAARLRMKRGAPGDAHEIRHLHAAITWGNTDDCDPAACKLDRLARAEAAVPDDPDRFAPGTMRSSCYACGRPRVLGRPALLGHKPDCKWLAARPAR
jgi:hypothetical protein